MRPPLVCCSAFASTLALACGEPSAPTAPGTGLEAVTAPTPALVARFSSPFFELLVDGDLVAVLGLGREQLAAFCAGDESVLDPIHIQEVSRPDGSLKVTMHSNPRLLIYSTAGASSPCDLASVAPLAIGKAHLARTDNDIFVSLDRTDSFGANLGGLASGEGGRFQVRARFRVTIQRNGEFRVRSERSGITRLDH